MATSVFLELTINHRQKDDAEYFALLERIRNGNPTYQDITTLNTRVVNDVSIYERFTSILPNKSDVENINMIRINQLETPGYTYEAKIVLDKYPQKTHNLEKLFPVASTLYLKVGVPVIMVANDLGRRWVNGTMGIVKNLTDESISVSIEGRVYDIYPHEFTQQEITYKNGEIIYEDVLTIVQYPLVPAYAITIHKSQGQTFKEIICNIEKCFESGQAYVALSRCKSLDGLHLSKPISASCFRVDRDVIDFYNSYK